MVKNFSDILLLQLIHGTNGFFSSAFQARDYESKIVFF